jgi:cold-inducible RNA-binding protein
LFDQLTEEIVMNIYVGNLSYDVGEEDLRQAFGAHGEVQAVNIIKDKYSGQSKGFGFVEMGDDKAGQAAIDALHETELKGRRLNVNVAKPRTERRDGGGSGGGGGRSGGGGGRGGGGGGFGGGRR